VVERQDLGNGALQAFSRTPGSPAWVKATPTRGVGARKLGLGVPGRLVGVSVDVPGGPDVRRRTAAPTPWSA